MLLLTHNPRSQAHTLFLGVRREGWGGGWGFKHSGCPRQTHTAAALRHPWVKKGKGSRVTIAHCFMCVNQECFGSLEVINQVNPGEVGRPLNEVEGERRGFRGNQTGNTVHACRTMTSTNTTNPDQAAARCQAATAELSEPLEAGAPVGDQGRSIPCLHGNLVQRKGAWGGGGSARCQTSSDSSATKIPPNKLLLSH